MNRHIRHVFTAYLLSLLAIAFFLPWQGEPLEGWADLPLVVYAPLWQPPRTYGYLFHLDLGRLVPVLVSLSAVMAAAAISLWGREDK